MDYENIFIDAERFFLLTTQYEIGVLTYLTQQYPTETIPKSVIQRMSEELAMNELQIEDQLTKKWEVFLTQYANVQFNDPISEQTIYEYAKKIVVNGLDPYILLSKSEQEETTFEASMQSRIRNAFTLKEEKGNDTNLSPTKIKK